MNASLRLETPSSPEAVEMVWEAYGRIPELEKKRLLKALHKKEDEMFKYLLKHGGFPAGASSQKVENRELSYGKKVDAFLRNHKGGRFGEDALFRFLVHSKNGVAVHLVQKLQDCASKAEAEAKLEEILDEGAENPMTVLGVRYFQAFINLEGSWIGEVEPNEEQDEEEVAPKIDETGESEPESPLSAGGFSVTALLDQALDDVIRLADTARVAMPWVHSDWESVILGAGEAVKRVRDEVARLARDAGRDMPEWQSREELDDLLETLRQEGDGKISRELLKAFLRGLAEEIRALIPLHKLASKHKRQAAVRDAAAGEIMTSCDADDPAWPEGGPNEPRQWLEWVSHLDGVGLEDLIDRLTNASYPETALLIEDLDRNYAMGEVKRSESAGDEFPSAKEPLTAVSPNVIKHCPPAAPVPQVGKGKKQPAPVATSEVGKTQPDESRSPGSEENGQSEAKMRSDHEISLTGQTESASRTSPVAAMKDPPLKEESQTHSDSAVPEPEPATTVKSEERLVEVSPEDAEDSESSTEVFEEMCELPEAAASALRGRDPMIEPAIEKVVWNLIGQGERTLAFEILKNADTTGLTMAFPLPPAVLEILALLPAYSSGSSEVPHRVRTILQMEDFLRVFKPGEPKANNFKRLLLAAALLRPSLFDPSSNAGAILEVLHLGRYPALQRIALALGEFGRKGVDLNATILSASLNTKGWKAGENEILEEVRRFQESAPNRKMNYAPATWIWRHWFQHKDGWMRRLFDLATSHDRKSMDALAYALDTCELEIEINKGWKESNGKGTLEGSALTTLHRLASEARDLVRRRLDHWKSNTHGQGDYRQKAIEELADLVAENHDAARNDLAGLLDSDERSRIAARLLLEELNSLRQALGGTSNVAECRNVEEWLRADLLRLDQIELDESMEVSSEEFHPVNGAAEFWEENDPIRCRLARELSALCHPIADWPSAFEQSLKRSDHQAARWILDQSSRFSNSGLGELESRKSAHAEETRNRLRRELKAIEAKLGSAFSKGWLTPDEHATNLALVQRRVEALADKNGWQDLPFHRYLDELAELDARMARALKDQLNKAEEHLTALGTISHKAGKRVRDILAKEDVQLANEYIQKLEAGESIDDEDEVEAFHHFVSLYGDSSTGGHFAGLFDWLSSPPPLFEANQAISDIQNNDSWCGIDIQHLDAGARSASAAALQRWFVAQRSKKIDEKGVGTILTAFDFPVTSVSHNAQHFIAHLAGVIPSPIPDFGTEVGWRITVIVELNKTSVDDVVQNLDRMKVGTSPVVLMWMRPVSLQNRRKFSRLCRQKSLKVLMIDTVLAAYVLATESPRLRGLFECGLPFTNVSPYTTTGGTLPEEMFFGRRREIEAIESAGQAGTCLVYGGRQIGKTVLLRKVERDFPRRGKHHIALYLDLNFHAVGQTVAVVEIWRIIADELSKKDPSIFTKTSRTQFTVEHFANQVTEWLSHDGERRILLLLDEADRFLQADSDMGSEPSGMPFQICQKLKGLMDSTRRRFKVVFAGLHNVQRSTRVINNPIAQLGTPVCVGPLYQNGESREAARLVSVPLAVSGVFFDSSDTVNAVLARTNYYPNLIQIFCSRLLTQTVDRQSRSHPDQTPPFRVTSEDVESIFSKHEIRDEIRKKFMLTLDLDRRFSLIAHHMAFIANDKPEGFTVDDIQRDAVQWWPGGFEADRPRSSDSLRDDLSVLLSEMHGLGILRRDANDHYFLRSPNVVALLGSPNDIMKVLEAAAKWESPPPYSPDSFRAPTGLLGDRCYWRSPLTARQETIIRDPQHPVIVISGCCASGINEVGERLVSVMGADYLHALTEVRSLEQFDAAFGLLRHREETGKTVLMVPSGCGWNLEWISQAKRRLSQFSAKDRAVGVIFLADAPWIWELLPDWKAIQREVGTGYLRLQNWDNPAIRQWLSDSGIPFDNLPWIHQATGGWHQAIRILGERVRDGGSIDSLVTSTDETRCLFRDSLTLKDAFGFPDDLAMHALEILAQFDEPIADSLLHELNSGQTPIHEPKKMDQTLEWAEASGVVMQNHEGWRIDPFVAKFISA